MSSDFADLKFVLAFAKKMESARKLRDHLADLADETARQLERRPDQRFKPAEREQGRAPSGPAEVSPLHGGVRSLFAKTTSWATADWYELLRPPPSWFTSLPRVLVPEGCLFTGGDMAWRREENL